MNPLARAVAVIAGVVFAGWQGSAKAQVINVAFGGRGNYPMAGAISTDSKQSATAGTAAPLVYTGSTWTQGNSGTGLKDSDGNTTGVGFATSNFKSAVGDHGGAGKLNLIGEGLHSDHGYGINGWTPDAGKSPTLAITGLDPGKAYDLVIISGGNYNGRNSFNVGATSVDWTAPQEPVFVGGTTLECNRDQTKGYAWFEGVNHAHTGRI